MPENTRLISKNGLCSLCREVAKDPRREPEEHPKIGRGRSQEEKVRFARRRGGNAGMERGNWTREYKNEIKRNGNRIKYRNDYRSNGPFSFKIFEISIVILSSSIKLLEYSLNQFS